jgi:type 1 fimbriae regulatory protein FimB
VKHLAKDELMRLLEVAKKHSQRNYLMILVAFSHGLRATEVVSLTAKNVQDGYITVQRLKSSLKTSQTLLTSSDPLFDEKTELESWIANAGDGPLFPVSRQTFWNIMQKHGKEAGLPRIRLFPHILKHTTAKIALAGGMKIDELKQYLGHRSLSSTGAYLVCDDEESSKAFASAMKL